MFTCGGPCVPIRQERQAVEGKKRRECEDALEKNRSAQEEAAQEEAARQAEIDRQTQEQERKALVTAFLKEHGYNDVGIPKRTMLKTKYPIHTAAKIGDPKIVTALLEEERSEEPRLNSSHITISYAVFCLKKKKNQTTT